jgi:hypothetical protein
VPAERVILEGDLELPRLSGSCRDDYGDYESWRVAFLEEIYPQCRVALTCLRNFSVSIQWSKVLEVNAHARVRLQPIFALTRIRYRATRFAGAGYSMRCSYANAPNSRRQALIPARGSGPDATATSAANWSATGQSWQLPGAPERAAPRAPGPGPIPAVRSAARRRARLRPPADRSDPVARLDAISVRATTAHLTPRSTICE